MLIDYRYYNRLVDWVWDRSDGNDMLRDGW